MRHFLCTILFLAVLPNAFTQFNVTGSLEAFVTKFGVSQERLDEVDNIDGSHYLLDTYEKGKLLI
jgi:hypothetical protein